MSPEMREAMLKVAEPLIRQKLANVPHVQMPHPPAPRSLLGSLHGMGAEEMLLPLAVAGTIGVGAAGGHAGKKEDDEDKKKVAHLVPADVVLAVQTHGLHKVAAELLGLPAITETTAAFHLGRKLASRRAEQATINEGLVALESLVK